MWDLPGPGLKPVSPELAGGFLTTVPPGKSQQVLFLDMNIKFHLTLSKDNTVLLFHVFVKRLEVFQ